MLLCFFSLFLFFVFCYLHTSALLCVRVCSYICIGTLYVSFFWLFRDLALPSERVYIAHTHVHAHKHIVDTHVRTHVFKWSHFFASYVSMHNIYVSPHRTLHISIISISMSYAKHIVFNLCYFRLFVAYPMMAKRSFIKTWNLMHFQKELKRMPRHCIWYKIP